MYQKPVDVYIFLQIVSGANMKRAKTLFHALDVLVHTLLPGRIRGMLLFLTADNEATKLCSSFFVVSNTGWIKGSELRYERSQHYFSDCDYQPLQRPALCGYLLSLFHITTSTWYLWDRNKDPVVLVLRGSPSYFFIQERDKNGCIEVNLRCD